jgi:hypothetical protein
VSIREEGENWKRGLRDMISADGFRLGQVLRR